MGMLSEVHAEFSATALQKPLLAAIESDSPEIIEFCRQHILPVYEHELGEIWSDDFKSTEAYQRIREFFKS